MTAQRFDFPNPRDQVLQALLEAPAGDPRAYALFAHCFTCSKESRAAKRIADALAARGVAVLRFDFTGLGSSEGDFANTDFSSNVADLVAAADHLRRIRRAPALLIGHSLGALKVAHYQALRQDPRVVGLVAASAALPAARPNPDLVALSERMVAEGRGQDLLPWGSSRAGAGPTAPRPS